MDGLTELLLHTFEWKLTDRTVVGEKYLKAYYLLLKIAEECFQGKTKITMNQKEFELFNAHIGLNGLKYEKKTNGLTDILYVVDFSDAENLGIVFSTISYFAHFFIIQTCTNTTGMACEVIESDFRGKQKEELMAQLLEKFHYITLRKRREMFQNSFMPMHDEYWNIIAESFHDTGFPFNNPFRLIREVGEMSNMI